nr:glycosyltransferase family 4 protein [Ardenticatena sp.]
MQTPLTVAQPLRIVFVAPFGLRPKGTVSVRALPLARALVARGHHVSLLIPPWDDPDSAGRTWQDAGVEVVNLPLAGRFTPPALVARLLAQTVRRRPHVVHLFKPKAYSGLVAAMLWQSRALHRATLVLDTDDWEGPGGWNALHAYPPPLKWVFAWQERYGLTHVHGVTVASRALETLVWAMGVSPKQVHYLPNGSTLPIPPNLERLAAHKRQHLRLTNTPLALLYTRFFEFDLQRLADVWLHVVQQLPAARLLVVGKGLFGEDEHFAHALRERGIAHTWRHVGWVEPDQLAATLRAADVALYPMDDTLVNRTKCPVKLADLMALGLPIVGEAVGQVCDYLDEGAGVLVPPGNVTAFADAVGALLRTPDDARRLGKQAEHRLRTHFAWAQQAVRVEAFYKRLIARRRS